MKPKETVPSTYKYWCLVSVTNPLRNDREKTIIAKAFLTSEDYERLTIVKNILNMRHNPDEAVYSVEPH